MHLLLTVMSTPTPETPSAAIIWAGATAGVGLLLWAAGGWLLRPAVGALGLGLGALGGWVIWLETGIGPMWVPVTIGGILAACVALLAYRLLAGTMLAVTLALLAASTTWTTMHLSRPDVPPPPMHALLGMAEPWEAPTTEVTPVAIASPGWPIPIEPSSLVNNPRWTPISAAWSQLPSDPRMAVLTAAAAAALAGFVVSTLFASSAAVLMTSAAGSLLVLAGAPRLLDHFDITPGWLAGDASESTLALAWLGASCVGLVIQAMTRPQPQSKSS